MSRVSGVDVVIVGRGGGSIEDLWAFNEEVVARAIARSPVPVISAVGHETDFTIADFVADLRAPTPSAAAELVVTRKDEFRGRIDRLEERLRGAARGRVQGLSRRVHMLAGRPGARRLPRPRRDARPPRGRTDARARARRCARAIAGRRAPPGAGRPAARSARDLGRTLAGFRTRLVGADARLTAAAASPPAPRHAGAARGRRTPRVAEPARRPRARLRRLLGRRAARARCATRRRWSRRPRPGDAGAGRARMRRPRQDSHRGRRGGRGVN